MHLAAFAGNLETRRSGLQDAPEVVLAHTVPSVAVQGPSIVAVSPFGAAAGVA